MHVRSPTFDVLPGALRLHLLFGFSCRDDTRGICMTWTALPITSSARFSPLGPLGIIRSY